MILYFEWGIQMSKITEFLKKSGCEDVANATEQRFLEDDEFYFSLLREVFSDDGFRRLGVELTQGQTQQAFDTAHMLKGVISNCGLTPLYNVIVQIVELLRIGSTETTVLLNAYQELLKELDKIKLANKCQAVFEKN